MSIVERTAPFVMGVILSLAVTAVCALIAKAIFNWGLSDLFHVTMTYKQTFTLIFLARYVRL